MKNLVFLEGKDLRKKVLCLSFLQENHKIKESLFWDQLKHLIVNPGSFEMIKNRLVLISNPHELSEKEVYNLYFGIDILPKHNVIIVIDDSSVKDFVQKREKIRVLNTTDFTLAHYLLRNKINVDEFANSSELSNFLYSKMETA